jgi:hypothetical protein
MPPVGFKPTISAGEGLQTYVLDRAASGTDDIPINLPSYLLHYFFNYIQTCPTFYLHT